MSNMSYYRWEILADSIKEAVESLEHTGYSSLPLREQRGFNKVLDLARELVDEWGPRSRKLGGTR